MTVLSDIFQSIEPRKKVSDHIYLTFKNAIIGGKLLPGEKLSEQASAEELQVSITSLREALKLLEYDEYISYDKGTGYMVSEITLEDIIQINATLGLIATECITQINPAQTSTKILLTQSVRQEKDYSNFDMDKKFHMTVALCTFNDEIMKIVKELYEKLRWGVNSLGLKDCSDQIVIDHRKILDRLFDKNEKDLQAVAQMMQNHYQMHLANCIER